MCRTYPAHHQRKATAARRFQKRRIVRFGTRPIIGRTSCAAISGLFARPGPMPLTSEKPMQRKWRFECLREFFSGTRHQVGKALHRSQRLSQPGKFNRKFQHQTARLAAEHLAIPPLTGPLQVQNAISRSRAQTRPMPPGPSDRRCHPPGRCRPARAACPRPARHQWRSGRSAGGLWG